jgi:glycosyltransferase involved in cell wall biosynthesis
MLSGLRPDLVHCHDLDTVPIGYLYATRRGIPWIFDAHECYPEQVKAQVHPIIYRRLLALEKFAARRATLTITVGELLAQRFDEMDARVVLVGNYQPLSPPDTPIISRQEIGLGEDEYLVAYIGGFLPQRAIQALVQAVDYAPDVRILLAGDGSTKDEILALCRTRPQVIYAGWVPLPTVPAYIQMADVVYYGLLHGDMNNEYSRPNALFYAMTAGKPLLTTRVGDIAHIVKQEQCGLVIDEASPQLIAAGLESLRDPDYRRKLGWNGRRAAQDRYNWEKAEKVLLEAYRSILES